MVLRRPALRWRKTKRKRWHDDRKLRGLKRPKPVAVIVVNCMSISTNPGHAMQILRNASEVTVDGLPVDIILGSECDDFNATLVLGLDWEVLHDNLDEDRDGTMLAVRVSRGRLRGARYEFGAAALKGAMRDRYLAVARVVLDPGTNREWDLKAVSLHAPPMRGWRRWPGYMRRVYRQHATIAGGDMNKLALAVEWMLRRKVRAVRILALAIRYWIPSSEPVPVNVGGDHLAVGVVLWPKR